MTVPGFNLSVVTPEGAVYRGHAESLVAPGLQGSFGVLAHHAPLIAALRLGILRTMTAAGTLYFVIGEGLLETHGNEVTVLADSAIQVADRREAQSHLIA